MKCIPCLLLLFFCTALGSADDSLPENLIQAAILQKVSDCNLESPKELTVFDLTDGKKLILSADKIWNVTAHPQGVQIGSNLFSSIIRIMPAEGEEFIQVNGKKYRDTIVIRQSQNGSLTVINELDLDHYIYGILPHEISASWHMEALKAQAVVSRTYALRNLERHAADGFHLCSTVHCQVFGGANAETSRTNSAVDKTHNEVIIYKDDLINAFFFANCGGKTEVSQNTWNDYPAPPYLKSVRCRYCSWSKHHTWKNRITEDQIAAALTKNGFPIELPIRTISIHSNGKSGRANNLKIKHAQGELKIRASQFRMSLGPQMIRSTWIKKIRKKGNSFDFQGRGWGHGIGFCQDGAKGFADAGAKYKKIIRLYYPGTTVEKGEDSED